MTTNLFADQFDLQRELGRGSFGVVHLALDTRLRNRRVALKILHPFLFQNEAGIMSLLRHDNDIIVTLYSAGVWQGQHYLVMDYIDGPSLAQVLADEGAQPPEQVVEWLRQTALALAAAHTKGVIHCDLKADNLLWHRARNRIYLTDFGLAKAVEARDGGSSGYSSEALAGGAAYRAPEVHKTGHTIASDLYSLGVVAYELLAGRRPFVDNDPLYLMFVHATDPVPPLPQTIPAALRAVVERLLTKDPTARYKDAAALLKVLTAVLPTIQQRWSEALAVYRQLDDLAGQATCYAALGDWAQAAACYEQAGHRAEVPKPDDETRARLADLFRQAAHTYAQNFEGRSARRLHCLQKVRYYCAQPWLTVSFAPEQTDQCFIVKDANVLLLTVTNLGGGLGRNVRVDLIDVEQPPRILLSGQETVAGIPRQRSYLQKVNLYASIGGGILVDVYLSWTDPGGVDKSIKLDRWTIPVFDPSKRGGSTPTTLHVGNVYYTSGGDVVHGDQYRDQAQNREGSVEIHRNRTPSTPTSPPPAGVVCLHCGTHNPAVVVFCDDCGESLSTAKF